MSSTISRSHRGSVKRGYTNTTSQPRNWINVSAIKNMTPEQKVSHIEFLLRKEREIGMGSDAMWLVYLLRIQGLVRLYFPRGNRFQAIFSADYSKHSGWDSNIGEERELLLKFSKALRVLSVNPFLFQEADKALGSYRHQLWLTSRK